jgi:hypothetical protein
MVTLMLFQSLNLLTDNGSYLELEEVNLSMLQDKGSNFCKDKLKDTSVIQFNVPDNLLFLSTRLCELGLSVISFQNALVPIFI